MVKLGAQQKQASGKLLKILQRYDVAYLAGEMRTGKTLTILETLGVWTLTTLEREVLWIAPKKAHTSIRKDCKQYPNLYVVVTTLESLHNYEPTRFSFVVLDEAHKVAAFPKPGKYAKFLRFNFAHCQWVLASGTPTPETFVQLFHQFWVTSRGPWEGFGNFYKWANRYVDKNVQHVAMGYAKVDYTNAKPEVMKDFIPYKVTMTQEKAGIKSKIVEHFHDLKAPDKILSTLRQLKATGYVNYNGHEIEPAGRPQLSQAVHQLCSGTIIDKNKVGVVVSDYKAQYIKKQFHGKKIAVYYVYAAEGDLLRKVFSNSTDNPEEFNDSGDKTFICQIRAGSQGVDLKTGEDLIIFNPTFSSVDYQQVRARMQNIKRSAVCNVHFLFSSIGFEKLIYDIVVNNKQRFTTDHFKSYVRNHYQKEDRTAIKELRLPRDTVKGDGPEWSARPRGFKARPRNVHRGKTARGKA